MGFLSVLDANHCSYNSVYLHAVPGTTWLVNCFDRMYTYSDDLELELADEPVVHIHYNLLALNTIIGMTMAKHILNTL